MRKTILALTAAIVTATATFAVAPAANATHTLGWNDGFNGTPLSLSKWNVRNGTYQSNSAEINYAANTSQTTTDILYGKALRLQARDDGPHTSGSRTTDYSSAYLDTIGKQTFQYGRFEMRAKLPTTTDTSKGAWPAFWLRPADGGNGEIDIMEAKGDSPTDTNNRNVQFTIHHDYLASSDPNHETQQNSTYTLPTGQTTAGWHTYGLDWTATSLTWTVDGVTVFTRNTTTTPWFTEVFNKPYNIRLNLQVSSGTFTSPPDSTTVFPLNYDVDYVNYYPAH